MHMCVCVRVRVRACVRVRVRVCVCVCVRARKEVIGAHLYVNIRRITYSVSSGTSCYNSEAFCSLCNEMLQPFHTFHIQTGALDPVPVCGCSWVYGRMDIHVCVHACVNVRACVRLHVYIAWLYACE
jgi:hypothetical protein